MGSVLKDGVVSIRCLMMYGVSSEREADDSSGSESEEEPRAAVDEQSVREDPDLVLIPTMLNKVVLPKITG